MIPQPFIDELIQRTDLVELIGTRVPLRRAGREFKACCPFHDEKTPSFWVSPVKQFYHCFGCGAHGTALGFLMQYERLGFLEAVEQLAARAGLTVPQAAGAAEGGRDESFQPLLEEAAVFYERALRTHPDAPRAVAYLKGRGLTGEIAKAYRIGFAPAGWDALTRALATTPERRQQAVSAGLLIRKPDGSLYDRFRDRIMFPIRDRRGRVIAFGGRVLDDGTPKYLNSPETPVFHKGRELYGLYEAICANRHLDRLMVVEGYMDVVGMARHGITSVVATLGTAATRDHFSRLYQTAPELVLAFDGDNAGRNAAWKAVGVALPFLNEGRSLRVLLLPEGEDPDTLVAKEGSESFLDRVANARPVGDFLFDRLVEGLELTTVDGQARLVERARPLLARLPEGGLRSVLTARLAELARLERPEIGHLIDAPSTARSAVAVRRQAPRGARTPRSAMTEAALALLLRDPALVAGAGDTEWLSGLDLPGAALLGELVSLLRNEPGLSVGLILERFREHPEVELLARAGASVPPIAEALAAAELRGTLDRLRERTGRAELARIVAKAGQGGLDALDAGERERLRGGPPSPADRPPGGPD